MKKTETSYTGWYFLSIVVAIYLLTAVFNIGIVIESLKFFTNIIRNIIFPLILVFILLVVTTYYVRPESVIKHLGKDAGAKGWVWSILGGILSTGPIYLWYPLLNELQQHGVRDGYIAAFIYNRAVKPALLPVFIMYFGIVYVVVLTVIMIIASIFQGVVMEKLLEVQK